MHDRRIRDAAVKIARRRDGHATRPCTTPLLLGNCGGRFNVKQSETTWPTALWPPLFRDQAPYIRIRLYPTDRFHVLRFVLCSANRTPSRGEPYDRKFRSKIFPFFIPSCDQFQFLILLLLLLLLEKREKREEGQSPSSFTLFSSCRDVVAILGFTLL